MTTDLEQVARAEAEQRFPSFQAWESHPNPIRAFEEGASWLAEYLLSDENVVDALSAFYGEERDGWTVGKVRRMRAALQAALGKETP